ncbi:MAG: hypothetical protein AUK32_10215 [Candidatus Aquicultor secundus]|nr:MAG: hypothetical protein AUK32_10215 [Candidatus Aquicultor secundus]PIU26161.1 MAG: hypothetical protein COT10_10150 [Candidatus Aquicultor secundus]PJB76941.1 MAG: hypothetical protein CO091_08495 [Candidatus Aquicultor secundus]
MKHIAKGTIIKRRAGNLPACMLIEFRAATTTLAPLKRALMGLLQTTSKIYNSLQQFLTNLFRLLLDYYWIVIR